MKYKVYEMEEAVTRNGKPFKKCVLKGEGQQNTEPRVMVWSDFPDFEKVREGAVVEGHIEKKDSGVPIPAHPNRNYVNRTLRTGDAAPRDNGDLASRVAKLERIVLGDEYPPSKPKEQKPVESDEINADDIPF